MRPCPLKFCGSCPNNSPGDHTAIARIFSISMIPPKTDPRWVSLLKGDINHRFSSAAASMLFFCLRARLKVDGSAAAVQQSVEEARAFFLKYERTLEPDIRIIFK